MKILQVTNRLPFPLNDGGNIATYNVTKFLDKLGHKVHLASLNTSKHFIDPKPLEEIATVHTAYLDNKITFFRVLRGIFQKQPFNVTRFYSEAFSELLTDLIKKEDFDVIQLEGIYLSVYISDIRKVTKIPVVLRSHNVEHEIWQRYAASERNPFRKVFLMILSRKIKRFEKKKLHDFDGIVAITARDEKFYRKENFRGKLTTINAGVDPSLFDQKEETVQPKSVCFLGSLEWVPNVQGLEWFLKYVWPQVSREEPEAEFHVAGKNPPEWLKKIKVQGMHFHGMVPDAVEFLKKYSIVVVPLNSGGGMRVKVVESMVLGKCIVTTSVGVEGIRIKKGRNIFVADKKSAFTKVLLELIRDPELVKNTGNAARETAYQYYSWNNLITRFESFYKSLCE